jgi:hypothetical protein
MQVVHQGSGTAPGGSLPLLSALPCETVIAQLSKHVLSLSSELRTLECCGAEELRKLSSCMATLAASPWIPQGDWDRVLELFLSSSTSVQVDGNVAALYLQLQLSAINIAVRFGNQPGVGIAPWLTQALTAQRWNQLTACVRIYIFLMLPAALSILPASAGLLLIRAATTAALADVAQNSQVTCAHLLQCAACHGISRALRKFHDPDGNSHATAATSEEGSKHSRLQAALLAAIEQAFTEGPAMPKHWLHLHVSMEEPPTAMDWSLIYCANAMLQSCSPVQEEALLQARSACMPVSIKGNIELPGSYNALLAEWASHRNPVVAPQRPSAQDLLLWAWHALTWAASAISLSQIERFLQGSNIDALAHSTTPVLPCAPVLPGTPLLSVQLRSATFLSLLAAEDPQAYSEALKTTVSCLTNPTAPVGVVGTWQAEWWQACNAASAALAVADVLQQQSALEMILRVARSEVVRCLSEEGSSGRVGGQSGGTQQTSLVVEHAVRLLCWASALMWEVERARQLGLRKGQHPGIGGRCTLWRCPLGWGPLLDLQYMEQRLENMTHQAWVYGLRGLPQAAPLLLRSEQWHRMLPAILDVLFGLWEGLVTLLNGNEFEVLGMREAERALVDALKAFWVELKPQQCATLLPQALAECTFK